MRVGVIGTGGMGNVHTRHWTKIEGVTTFAYDSDQEKLDAFCATHGVQATRDLTELLEQVDAVDICLPTHLHLATTLSAVEAGKAVLCEKPMARTVGECRQMIDAAERAGVLLSVAHVVRYFPEHRRAHELVMSGAVGTPAAVRMRRGGKAPIGSGGWFRDAEKSGGVLLDLAIHEFDWLRWTLGEATQVYSRSVRLGPTVSGVELEGDYALTTITFESGAVAHVEATWMDPSGFRTTLEVAGSDGILEFDSRTNPTLRFHTGDASTNQSFMGASDDPYFRQLSAFKRAFDTGTSPEITGLDGLRAVGIAQAAIESATNLVPVVPER